MELRNSANYRYFTPTLRPPPQVRREHRASAACEISRRQALPVEDVKSFSVQGAPHRGATQPKFKESL